MDENNQGNQNTQQPQGFNPFNNAPVPEQTTYTNTNPAQSTTPQPQPTTANQQQPKIFSPLSVPVASPTHFDQPYPSNPSTTTPITNPTKPTKKLPLTTLIAGVAATAFLIIAIFFIIMGIDKDHTIANLASDLNNKTAIVQKIEEETETTINTPAEVPAYTSPLGYIYISDWNIKLKIPDNLVAVSYILNEYNYRNSICFNAYQKGTQYAPAFADPAQNPGGMGCLQRVPSIEGNNNPDTGLSFGQKVYTYKDNNYFYTAPAATFSQDTAEQGLEATAVQIIKNMITDNISIYE